MKTYVLIVWIICSSLAGVAFGFAGYFVYPYRKIWCFAVAEVATISVAAKLEQYFPGRFLFFHVVAFLPILAAVLAGYFITKMIKTRSAEEIPNNG